MQTKLSEKYRIRRLRVIRSVFAKLLALAFLAVVLVRLFNWRDIVGEKLLSEVGDVVVPSLIAVVLALLTIFDLIYEALFIRSFEVTSDGMNITIRKGVISTHEVTLPFDRITDIYVDQSILDRLFALYNLHFSTPTTASSSAARIEGLSKKDCYQLRQEVLDALRTSRGSQDL